MENQKLDIKNKEKHIDEFYDRLIEEILTIVNQERSEESQIKVLIKHIAALEFEQAYRKQLLEEF